MNKRSKKLWKNIMADARTKQTIQVSTGRLITWALGLVTLVVVTLGTCIADSVNAELRLAREEREQVKQDVTARVIDDAKIEARLDRVDEILVDILAEIKTLKKED